LSSVTIQENHGLALDGGRILPWISGTFHYWRVEPELWEKVLQNIKAMGFGMVETYIPWGVHEEERGKFDFGEKNPRNNLERFFRTVHEADLKLVVRPGPHINAELTYFGYPERIVFDPEIVALEASGAYAVNDAAPKAFGLPSYASRKFYDEVAIWFDALTPLLKRHLYPKGPIVALQVDNETGYFFRTDAYVMDYHPDSIVWYHDFLKLRYGTIQKLNECYTSSYKSFDQVEPPCRFDGKTRQDLPYYLDWARYREWHVNESLRRIGGMWRQRGVMGIPFFQNFYGPTQSPYNLNEAEHGDFGLDIAGLDSYPRKEAFSSIARMANYLAGTSKLPLIPEFGSGCWAYYLYENALDVNDQRFTTPLLFMFGLKAVNYYMLVERDRWTGSPIRVDNQIRKPYFDLYQGLNAFLRSTDFTGYRMDSDLLVLFNYDVERFLKIYRWVCDHPYHPLPAELAYADLPGIFEKRIEEEFPLWAENQWQFCLHNHLPFHSSDTFLPLERMKNYKAVWVVTFDFMDRKTQQQLRHYVEKGGTVILGPVVPCLDENMKPFSLFQELQGKDQVQLGRGRLVLLKDWEETSIRTALGGIQPIFPSLPKEILATSFRRDESRILFFANPGSEARSFSSPLENGRLVPLWGASNTVETGQNVELEPWSVGVWEVKP
jgi:beta-galactosidase